MNEKETILLVVALAAGFILLRKPKSGTTSATATAQLAAQQQAQLAAQQAAASAARGGTTSAQQAGAIAAGIGQGLGSLLAGIGALTGAGSGTNKENGGSYSYESTKIVDEYEAIPEYYTESSDDSYYGVD